MRLHSDENIHCASQSSSLEILNALKLGFANFSGNKEPHSYLPIGAIQKNEPLAFLSIATSRP